MVNSETCLINAVVRTWHLSASAVIIRSCGISSPKIWLVVPFADPVSSGFFFIVCAWPASVKEVLLHLAVCACCIFANFLCPLPLRLLRRQPISAHDEVVDLPGVHLACSVFRVPRDEALKVAVTKFLELSDVEAASLHYALAVFTLGQPPLLLIKRGLLFQNGNLRPWYEGLHELLATW